MDEALLGPLAALALALLLLGLFYNGRILPRNAVPREDFDKVVEINGDYAKAMTELTKAIDRLVLVVEYQQRNGGSNVGKTER